MASRRQFLGAVGVAMLATAAAGCGSGPHLPRLDTAPNGSVDRWLAQPRYFVAHRGGDADWTQATAFAYRNAVAWNPLVALEAPVWKTVDGVWVVSESRSTAAVFGDALDISTSTWPQLSRLRSLRGSKPMSRLVEDVLTPYARHRILFVDNKSGKDPEALLTLMARFGGPRRIVLKSYCRSTVMPAAGRRAGYRTWGYYYAADMPLFDSTQSRFDLLGLNYSASQAQFAAMRQTGKAVIAHIIGDSAAAHTAFAKGARGLMVSGVTQVVEHAVAA